MIDGRMSDFQSYQKYVGVAQGIDLSCQSIDETIKQISNRGFLIKDAIEWRKFTSGAI